MTNEKLNGFEGYLAEQGLSKKSILGDYRDVTLVFGDKKLAYRTKELYRAALRHWAQHIGDDALFAELSHKKTYRAIKDSSPRVDRRVTPLSQEDFDRLIVVIDGLKGFHDWRWPAMTACGGFPSRAT